MADKDVHQLELRRHIAKNWAELPDYIRAEITRANPA
jgi:hypothetical protein